MLQYVTLHYVTLRDATQRLRYEHEKYFCVGLQRQQRCVYLCVFVSRCIYAILAKWSAASCSCSRWRERGEGRGCNVDNQQTQCANNSPACIIDEQLLFLLFFFFCLDWLLLLLLLLNFFVSKKYCVYLNKKPEEKIKQMLNKTRSNIQFLEGVDEVDSRSQSLLLLLLVCPVNKLCGTHTNSCCHDTNRFNAYVYFSTPTTRPMKEAEENKKNNHEFCTTKLTSCFRHNEA